MQWVKVGVLLGGAAVACGGRVDGGSVVSQDPSAGGASNGDVSGGGTTSNSGGTGASGVSVVGDSGAIELGPLRCSPPPDPGPCRGAESRYYFDVAAPECLPFTYGGCQGNDNNFLTKDECDATCRFQGVTCTTCAHGGYPASGCSPRTTDCGGCPPRDKLAPRSACGAVGLRCHYPTGGDFCDCLAVDGGGVWSCSLRLN